jgi:hypothetical protein
MTKCALVAALISAALVAGVELGGSAMSSAHAGLGGTLKPPAAASTAPTAPASTPR